MIISFIAKVEICINVSLRRLQNGIDQSSEDEESELMYLSSAGGVRVT